MDFSLTAFIISNEEPLFRYNFKLIMVKTLVKILIGGMGRSGTSLFSKLFQDLNCNLSNDLLDPEINAGIEIQLISYVIF